MADFLVELQWVYGMLVHSYEDLNFDGIRL